MRYKHEAKITVRLGRFPLDMLRYDSCYPATQQDSAAMENYTGSREEKAARVVTVCKVTGSKFDGFTVGRWQSFGCDVEIIPVRKL